MKNKEYKFICTYDYINFDGNLCFKKNSIYFFTYENDVYLTKKNHGGYSHELDLEDIKNHFMLASDVENKVENEDSHNGLNAFKESNRKTWLKEQEEEHDRKFSIPAIPLSEKLQEIHDNFEKETEEVKYIPKESEEWVQSVLDKNFQSDLGIKTPKHYDNSKGTLYKVAEERNWSPYLFDIVKRLERANKKGEFKTDLEKSIAVIQLWLKESKS